MPINEKRVCRCTCVTECAQLLPGSHAQGRVSAARNAELSVEDSTMVCVAEEPKEGLCPWSAIAGIPSGIKCCSAVAPTQWAHFVPKFVAKDGCFTQPGLGFQDQQLGQLGSIFGPQRQSKDEPKAHPKSGTTCVLVDPVLLVTHCLPGPSRQLCLELQTTHSPTCTTAPARVSLCAGPLTLEAWVAIYMAKGFTLQ